MNRFNVAAVLAGVAALAAASGASATTVIGAKTITITSALPSYIQISELRALDFSNVDVALSVNGATTSVSSNYGSSSPAYAIDGVYPSDYDHIFHSNGAGSSEFFTLTLASPTTLSALQIFGRAGCCTERDVYNYSIFNAGGDLLASGGFDANNGRHTDSVTFDKPAEGRGVPEPASWALAIMGFGATGAMLRRRRLSLHAA